MIYEFDDGSGDSFEYDTVIENNIGGIIVLTYYLYGEEVYQEWL